MDEIEKDFPHRQFRDDRFWQEIPAWKDVSESQFADYKWQSKNSIRKLSQLKEILGNRISNHMLADIQNGLEKTPMNIRITPYVFSLIDWENPVHDPLRKQFLPIASQFLPNHPYYMEDSLHEDVDSPIPLLTHRYPDKVLFLPLTTCPVYCSYCTRSRVIGGSTESVEKDTYGANATQWEGVFEYLRKHKEVEDVVVSGGDSYNLTAKQVRYIGETLLNIPNIRRIRYATKGIAIFPMKVLTDDSWFEAILEVIRKGRSMGKQVFIHTHFSSPREITVWSKRAMERLWAEGVVVRNQAVLQTGVNDTVEQMTLLTKKLGYINIQPYYVYIHDMVPGCEHFRTTLAEAIELEKAVRGSTAGFNIPTFVCDAPGGGGKRNIGTYEVYDRENGISVWTAPEVKPGEVFVYFDPIHKLSLEAQERWKHKRSREQMLKAAVRKVNPNIKNIKKEIIEKRLAAARA